MVVENFLNEVRSKPPTEWTASQLEDFGFAAQYIYKYTNDKQQKEEIRKVYAKIVGIVNNDKSAHFMLNPGALNNLDKK